MQIDRTRRIFYLTIGVTAVVILGAFGFNAFRSYQAALNGGAGMATAPVNTGGLRSLLSGPVQITFFSSNTKEDWIDAVTAEFNEQGFQTPAGQRIEVSVTHGNSGGSQQEILDGALTPTIWSPGEQSWVNGADQFWREVHGQSLLAEECAPTVYAPIGFGMWRPMAEALGWPDEAISWDTIVELAADPEGWATYGHPEWGQFRFGHTHPDYSNSGLLMLTALAYDALDKTGGVTFDEVKSEAVKDAMRNVELHTYHYGRQSRNLADMMALNGPSYLHAITMTEAEVLRTNRERAEELRFPLAFIFPANGTFWAEQPLCILDGDWVSEEQQEAARIYRDYLLAPEQQALTVDYGLRPVIDGITLHDPITLDNGSDPRVTTATVAALESPSADVAEAVKEVFKEVKKKATVYVLLDTSGSMTGAKMKEAAAATAGFVERLERGDEIAVATFSSEITELRPLSEVSAVKERLAQTILNLYAGGDTLLYDAICEGVADVIDRQAANAASGEQRLYGIVVLSDGDDSGSQLTENEMLACLPQTGEDGEGIKIFTIAFGSGANNALLQRVASRTNGRFFEGDPGSINEVYTSISAEQ